MKSLAGLGWCFIAALCMAAPLPAQRGRGGGGFNSSMPPITGPELPSKLLEKPSQPPAFSVPVQPLGFSAPGPEYMGKQTSLASLDFLDEDHLLFTFRVPGLIRRAAETGVPGASEERQIRAVLLSLPAGTVEAEALWTLHDRVRYLWMLKDGHFLLRDGNALKLGDATLELKPYLRFPGPLLYLEMDPSQQFMVADTSEPAAKTANPGTSTSAATGAGTSLGTSPDKSPAPADLVVRVLRREGGQVMLVSRTSTAVHLPINADGILEREHRPGDKWVLNLNLFSGGNTTLGQLDSIRSPGLDFISQYEILATTFPSVAERKLRAIGANGRHLWEYSTYQTTAWPLGQVAANSSRLVWEALVVNPEVSSDTPTLGPDDVKGQLVEVLNAANGKVALDAPASPPLDAGGNVAISPSGDRVAVIFAGQIQVYNLPPAPPLPELKAR
ncbi:MAG: hypothetical protein ABR907_06775 [Terracidiphilus sp.]